MALRACYRGTARDRFKVLRVIYRLRDGCQDDIISPISPTTLMNDFGKRLQEIRTDAGLTQSGLARALNTSQSAISQMERGDREPSFRMLRRLARALGVSPAHLLGQDVDELSPAEQVHFRRYRSLPDEAKAEIRDFAEYLRQKHTKSR